MPITICFVGDLMLGRDTHNTNTFTDKLEYIRQNDFSRDSMKTIYGSTLYVLSKADLVVANLETVITNHNVKYPKTFNYRIHPGYARALLLNKNTFFNIGNNHIMDYQVKGLHDTISALTNLNNDLGYTILASGAGTTKWNALRVSTFNIKGKVIKVIGCTDYAYDGWASTDTRSGVYLINYNDYSELLNKIREVKDDGDILILSIHWGGNYVKGIKQKYQQFAKDAVDAGVDIIHGHSSHHIKCIHHDGRKVIMYGLGDFIDDYAVDSYYRNDYGMIVKVVINDDSSFRVSVLPTVINDRQVNLLDEGSEGWNFVQANIKEDCKI